MNQSDQDHLNKGKMACHWCRQGLYQPLVVPAHGNYKNYGLGGAEPEKWRLVRCDQCGHVQWFRDA